MNNTILSFQIFTEDESTAKFDKLLDILKKNNRFRSVLYPNLTAFYSQNNDIEINVFNEGIIEILARIDSETTQGFIKLISSLSAKTCRTIDTHTPYTMELFIHEEKPIVIENILNKDLINEDIKEVDFVLNSVIKVKIIKNKERYTAHIKLKDDFDQVKRIYPHFIEKNNPIKKSFHVSNLSLGSTSKITSF